MERDHIQKALALMGGNKTMAAGMLGITRPTLNNKLKEHQIAEEKEQILENSFKATSL